LSISGLAAVPIKKVKVEVKTMKNGRTRLTPKREQTKPNGILSERIEDKEQANQSAGLGVADREFLPDERQGNTDIGAVCCGNGVNHKNQ
jgi:hypothetical protein